MSQVSQLMINLLEDIEMSEALFGVKPESVSTLDVGYGFATDWVTMWFGNSIKDRTPDSDVSTYLRYFRKAVNARDNFLPIGQKVDK